MTRRDLRAANRMYGSGTKSRHCTRNVSVNDISSRLLPSVAQVALKSYRRALITVQQHGRSNRHSPASRLVSVFGQGRDGLTQAMAGSAPTGLRSGYRRSHQFHHAIDETAVQRLPAEP